MKGYGSMEFKTNHTPLLLEELENLLKVAEEAQIYVRYEHLNCQNDKKNNRVNNDLINACLRANATLSYIKSKSD